MHTLGRARAACFGGSSNGYYEIARLLLENGAHPNVEVESSADTLSIALMHGDQKMADLLCSYGAARAVPLLAHYGDIRTAAAVFAANPPLADDPDALASAAGNGHEGFVRLMLRYRPDLATRIADGASTRELTELLFERGMNPNQANWLGITPLHRFAEMGDLERAAVFIDHGADLDARDEEFSSTPLGYAAKYGKTRMAEFLLRRGAKPNLPDDPPWATPLAWATRRGHDQIARLLTRFEQDGSLPDPIRLAEYESLAEDLVNAYSSEDAGALQRIVDHFQRGRLTNRDQLRRYVGQRLGTLSDSDRASDTLALADAQRLIARAHGFEDWSRLVKHIEDERAL